MSEGMETASVTSLLAVDASMLVDIKKELEEIHIMMDASPLHVVRPGSPPSAPTPVKSPSNNVSIRKRFKTAVRQLVFMEKAKDKMQEAYENESMCRLRNMPSLSLLCAVPLFQSLDSTALMDLNAHVQVTSHAANSTIFAKGLESSVYIIRCGTAWVKAPGKERSCGEFHHDDVMCDSGDIIDPVEFLSKNDQYKCVAVGPVEALAIPREVVLKYNDKLPTLSTSLHSVRYTNKASESFRKWASHTAGLLRHEARDISMNEPTIPTSPSVVSPQSFIREILLSISPELDLDHCIQCMARLFARVLHASTIRLFLLSPRGTHFITKFATDTGPGVQVPTSLGIPGLVYRHQLPVQVTVATADVTTMPQVDWVAYRKHKSILAVPVFQAKTTDVVLAVWEVISDSIKYSSHEKNLLELAATFMQPYLSQCDRPTHRLGSVSQVETPSRLRTRILRLATKASSIQLTVGLYHGHELLVPEVMLESTRGTALSGTGVKEFEFDGDISFQCSVQSLPRAVHVLWRVQTVAKQSKLLAHAALLLFSYDHFLRTGTVSLRLTHASDGELLPIGFEECILPSTHRQDNYIVVDFPKYQYPLTYRSNDIAANASLVAPSPSLTDSAAPSPVLVAFMKDPMRPLTKEHKEYLWTSRHTLTAIPAALMPFLLSVDWANRVHVTEAYTYMYRWSAPTYLQALQLLSRKFPDPFVRAYAVRCLDSLPDYRLRLYLLQLVQALKYEPHHDSALMRFLFVRAVKSPSEVGYALFWLLQAELHLPNVHERFQLLSTQYLCHCSTYRLELYQSAYMMRLLEGIATQVKQQQSKAACDATLRQQLGAATVPECFQLPLHPNVFYTSFVPDQCRVMDSAKKPLFLCLTPMKQQAPSSSMLHSTIFKCGDDLRQDQLTLQLLRVMDDLWKSAALDLKVLPYACVSTGHNIGFIQVVHQASTLASICWERHRHQKSRRMRKAAAVKTAMWGKNVLAEWLAEKTTDSNEDVTAMFVLSCAGYCVATYVLGIGDRHNDNLMLTESGRFLHIDFGHFLGHFKTCLGYKRERAPFVLTPAMVHAMGDQFDMFRAKCVLAFAVLRANASLLITLLELALSSGIPELTPDTIPWLSTSLMLDLTDDEATAKLEALIDQALCTVTTRINHATHILAH
ncbi:hypothetical protein H310_05534 [Aphanomyces invadans]|uniref:Phosphatidylinositol 3-kinase n=1 Tax=Aphanomyces invadans TaxID=157072 RepID=A0A024UBU2_9STRA|nr:hypothetical protein H310_05534 [Aphanomyces invadans]ETW03108.1 hypothetical protein H310_05534 [Aphanomyces invadans]|eukprot:XP_008868492.1 hypothetical protein H310_05534 [Aphanomyces invadans]